MPDQRRTESDKLRLPEVTNSRRSSSSHQDRGAWGHCFRISRNSRRGRPLWFEDASKGATGVDAKGVCHRER